MMNLWRCDHPGCGSQAYGAGGVNGLRAIGWSVHGGRVFCPPHRQGLIPFDIQESLDCIERSLGELAYFRDVIESMKAEDPVFVERHALIIAKRHLPAKGETLEIPDHEAIGAFRGPRTLLADAVEYVRLFLEHEGALPEATRAPFFAEVQEWWTDKTEDHSGRTEESK